MGGESVYIARSVRPRDMVFANLVACCVLSRTAWLHFYHMLKALGSSRVCATLCFFFHVYAVGFTKWEEQQMQLESALDGMPENGTLFLDMRVGNHWTTLGNKQTWTTFSGATTLSPNTPRVVFPVLHLTKLSLFSNLSITSQHVKSRWMSSIEQIPEQCLLYIWSLLCGGIRVLDNLEKVEDTLHHEGVIGVW